MSSTGDRQDCEAPWTGYEKEVLMPTRITRPAKWKDNQQSLERKSLIAPLVGYPKASYMAETKKPASYAGHLIIVMCIR